MANFRKGAEAITKAATRSGGGGFTPSHRFEAGETKYLQFLTPIEDVFTVLMHRFIVVGYKDDGKEIYKDFISRRDEGLDGPEGYDELIDRFELTPSQRSIAIAIELEPIMKQSGSRKVINGWKIVEREYTDSENNDVSVPNIALVVESPFTFFGHLTAHADIKPIEASVFAVKRTGKSTDTQYTLIEAGAALEDDQIEAAWDSFVETFDIEEYLEELADEDRMKELISDLPDDFPVSRFGGKKKAKKDSKSTSTRNRRSTAREEAAAEEDDEDENGSFVPDEDAEQEEPKTARRRSFGDLKKTMK